MFNRIELKKTAKKHHRVIGGIGILVTFLFALVNGVTFNFSINLPGLNKKLDEISKQFLDSQGYIVYTREKIEFAMHELEMYWLKYGRTILIILSIVTIISLLYIFLLRNPLQVGFRRWYLESREMNTELYSIGSVFSSDYMNVVKVMFCRDLFIALWTCLFIIPGIIKVYEYRMVPYLLAENPRMGINEALGRSRNLMRNNKFETFVLDMSFIGWRVLSAFTLNVLSILYVEPYAQYTETELYVKLCQKDNYTKPDYSGEERNSYTNSNF